VLRVRDLVRRVGGVAALTALLDAVTAAGGWGNAADVMDAAEALGGADKLRQLLELLKF
jgi:hypothetical protein